jgi:C4-dicarboxylate-specific signal transduction histidine kinase
LAQEQEKQRLLASQNEMLEQQVQHRTTEVVAQKEALQHTLNELKATQAQLVQKEKMASLGELTAGIAHEIQNPLNFVNNFSEANLELLEELEEEIAGGNIALAKQLTRMQGKTKVELPTMVNALMLLSKGCCSMQGRALVKSSPLT